MAFGDLEGDGDLDLFVGGDRKVVVLSNDSGGRFFRGQTLRGGGGNEWVRVGDLDADGDLDVMSGRGPDEDTDGSVWAWENKGSDGWSDAGRVGTTVDPVVTADLTGDGRADVVTATVSRGGHGSNLLVAQAC